MPWVRRVKNLLEYLGGERDDAPGLPAPGLASPAWGLWWGLLLTVIYVFSGQSSKFIYIDF